MSFHQELGAVAALAVVLALVLAARVLLGRARGLVPQLIGRRAGTSGRRLALRETLALDARRRLLLVSVDGRDVLLLVGGANDLVVAPAGPAP